VFPPQTNNFHEPIRFKSVLGNEFFGKKGEKPSEEKPSEEKPEPKENPKMSSFWLTREDVWFCERSNLEVEERETWVCCSSYS
jgi:hypothetical protein